MARSIRWRLQLGTGLLLTAVVGGFAGLLYVDARASRDRRIEAELRAVMNYMDSALRRWPIKELDPNHPPPPPPGKEFPKDWDRPPKEKDRLPRDRPPPTLDHLKEILVPPEWSHPGPEDRYYGVWADDGTFIHGSAVDPNRPPLQGMPHEMEFIPYRGGWEVTLLGPHRTRVLVGCGAGRSDSELARFGVRLLLTGAGVLLIGFAGAWWLGSRIVTPLTTITTAASRISAANLSERIDVTGVDRELAELVEVLNDTFSRLDDAFSQLTRFTADASHELRTPLAVLRTSAELALSRQRSPEDYRSTLNASLATVTRMTAIVDGLLTLARADTGAVEVAHKPVNLAGLVKESVTALMPIAESYRVLVTVKTEQAIVLGDEVALGRVVANLVENAIRYNKPEGTVEVTVQTVDSTVELIVTDTGVGISDEHLPHIFERFYRVDAARARSSGGTGLGLAICKSVVEAHAGEISVTSTEGVGTTFRVRFPRARRARPARRAKA